jgi:signal transduction histidine kinase
MSTTEYVTTAMHSDSASSRLRQESPVRGSAVASATLADVDILTELADRPSRSPNYEREHRAFVLLAREMAENPRNLLQKLAEIAVDLCDAHTAGVTLADGDVSRWEAVAGVFAGVPRGTMPRHESPCGVCIDRDATQLMYLADRYFPAVAAEPRFVESLLIPFHDHGTPIGAVWIVSHTRERKFDREDERILKVLSGFAATGWQLWKTNETVVAQGRRKDEFIATLSHELRNPIGVIVTATAIVRQRSSGDALAVQAVDIIARQSHHVSRLIDDLLDMSRIDCGKLQLERRAVDLRGVVAESVEERRPQIERRRHSLTLDLGTEAIFVDADPVRLAQVVSNLIDNAAKYTPVNGHLSVTVSHYGDEAAVAVLDTGLGIAADQLLNIFEPFNQLPESRASSAGGLGLGLPLVRRLTEMHGGTVSLVSPGLGRGSCFTVRLPSRRATAHTTPCSLMLPPALVADDHRDVEPSNSAALISSPAPVARGVIRQVLSALLPQAGTASRGTGSPRFCLPRSIALDSPCACTPETAS